MSKDKDEPKKVEVKGDNNIWDFKKAVDEKTTCVTCAFGAGPFLLQGQPSAAGVVVAPVFACENTQSFCYMTIRTGLASCKAWLKKQPVDKPSIVIAHKNVPPFKIGGLGGDKK